MPIRKSIVLIALFLAAIAVGLGLLGGKLPTLRAAQESGQRPRASLHIAAHPPRILFDTAEAPVDYPRYLKTQEGLIRSDLVLDVALRDPKVSRLPSLKDGTDSIAWLRRSLEVTNPKDSEILQVSLSPASGLSGPDQAVIINAVVRAYIDEVVNVDLKRRMERLDNLKKLKEKYNDLLRKKRETLRRLAESVGRDERIQGLEKEAWPRLYGELRSQRIKLRMERAEVETLLERRKKAGGAAADAARKEIPQLEDRLAVLTAGQKVLDEELERLAVEMHGTTVHVLDLKSEQDEVAQMEEAARKIAAEVEALSVEIQAPPRVRQIDRAKTSSP
jgi:hypothetical protein